MIVDTTCFQCGRQIYWDGALWRHRNELIQHEPRQWPTRTEYDDLKAHLAAAVARAEVVKR